MNVIVGATGRVGRHVVQELVVAGRPVRAVSRDPAAAGLPAAAEVVAADPSRPGALEEALEGAETLFMSYPAVRDAAADVAEAARRHGVGRIVFLSSAAVVDGVDRQPDPIAELHRSVEEAVEKSGVEWCFLRPDMFAGNTLLFWGSSVRSSGVVRAAYADAALAPIDERDVGAAAARALVGSGHAGATYRLTGPEALTQRAMLQQIAAATGLSLVFEEISPAQAVAQMVRQGVQQQVAEGLLAMHSRYTKTPMAVSAAVGELTGRAPYTFSEWAEAHAEQWMPVREEQG